MKRSLTSSEKFLLTLCLTVLAGVGFFFMARDYRTRRAVAQEKIADLEPGMRAAEAAAADAPFWQARGAWLDQAMPEAPDPGKAHSQFLAELRDAAHARGLTIGSPVLLKPEAGKYAREFAVTLQVSGPDNAVLRWLCALQTPEHPQIIKYLLLAPQSTQPPRMSGTVTVARLFKP